MDIDRELLRACMEDSRRAQNELYKQCYSIMMSICFRYENNKEDAEFLMNKAFFKVLKNLDKYNSDTPFEAWLRRITINTAIDAYRKAQRQKLDYVEEPSKAASSSQMNYNEADQRFNAVELQNMINSLPPASKAVFNLYAIDGYSHKEIAEKLKMSEGTSKWHLSSARKKLQELVQKMMNNVSLF